MAWLITKYLITAGVVVAVSEFAKRSDRLGAFIAALPLVTAAANIGELELMYPAETAPAVSVSAAGSAENR